MAAEGLTIKEAHDKTAVGPADVAALVAELGIDDQQLQELAVGAIERVALGGTFVAGAVAMRAFVAGILWERSRGA
jgi:hypothetical protein